MRIIAGSAGGIPLKVPAGVARPTTDRVREALFSMLGGSVADARVLDLYAGSGSLGMEALSRGAAAATFIDQSHAACAVIEENLRKTRLAERASVKKAPVNRALEHLAAGGARVDLVFADPPYAGNPGGHDDPAFALLENSSLLALLPPGGTLVLECRSVKGEHIPPLHGWRLLRDRDYGGTRILWLEHPPHVPSLESPSV